MKRFRDHLIPFPETSGDLPSLTVVQPRLKTSASDFQVRVHPFLLCAVHSQGKAKSDCPVETCIGAHISHIIVRYRTGTNGPFIER